MHAAQAEILQFRFGVAMSKQQNCEAALERIITVLSRRREPDEKMLQEIAEVKRDLTRILEQQKQLTQQTQSLLDKPDLQRAIAAAKQRLQDVHARQEKLLDQTKSLNNAADAQAGALEAGLDQARKDLDSLIKDENAVFESTKNRAFPRRKKT